MSKKKKLTPQERFRRDHRLDEDVQHKTRVVGAGKEPMGRDAEGNPIRVRMYRSSCSCGWWEERKYADQSRAAKDAIRHQLAVRHAATQREQARVS